MPADAKYIEKTIRRFKAMDSNRGNWRAQWEDNARFGAPRRMGAEGPRTDGDRRIVPQIYNPIGINCVQTLAAALHGMVMNPATKWLNIRMQDDDLNELEEAKQWTNATSKRIAATLASPKVAFHTNANQLLEDMSSLGTAVMYCGQQRTGPLYVRTFPVFECCIAENEYGFVDTVIRDGMYDVRQLVTIWGDKVPSTIRALYDQGKYDEKFKVLNACQPRPDEYRDTRKKTRDSMPISICYIFEKEQHLLEESGAEEMPYVVPRWWVASGEVYGRSPLMTALPQIKVANMATKDVMDAAEKAVSPPLTVPHEALVGPVRSGPNGLTYLRGKAEIGQIPTSANLPFANDYIMQLENSIRTTMFVDQVQFVGDFKMTATEVMQRQTERMRLLGPVLGRLETEFLNPFITRVFGIMARNGLIERAPEAIQDKNMRIEYQSPLARAQKSQIAQGFQQVLATLEPIAKMSPALAEQLFAPIDVNKVTPMLFEWYGVDLDLLKHEKELASDDQQTKLRNMIQQVPALAKALRDGMGAVQAGASAGKTAVDTAAVAQQMPPLPQPQGPGVGAPQPVGPPPAPGGVGAPDLSRLLPPNIPGVGNISDMLRNFSGPPQ